MLEIRDADPAGAVRGFARLVGAEAKPVIYARDGIFTVEFDGQLVVALADRTDRIRQVWPAIRIGVELNRVEFRAAR